MSAHEFAAVLLAAGGGTRMGGGKLLARFAGKTPLELCLEAFEDMPVVVVAAPELLEHARSACAAHGADSRVVTGADTRQGSALCGLRALWDDVDYVMLHDAARCLIDVQTVRRLAAHAREHGCAVACAPCRDTVRDAQTGAALDRSRLLLMQTPQVFKYRDILAAHERFAGEKDAPDDAELYARAGGVLSYVECAPTNAKLTYPADRELFDAVAWHRRAGAEAGVRVGYGEDTHRYAEGRELVLGGVSIAYRMGLLGHSDADALTHAVTDALLGAAALGDIGAHFPDTDSAYEGCRSLELLARAGEMLGECGWRVANVDATVVAQEPKLAPHIGSMRANIARALGVDAQAVSVKATTPEWTGPEGRLECVTARAVASIAPSRI
ncbi:MAG: 2-C-methyl-D-erythritol 2,4-cyclodiphosphate synthase [Clostridia bacterium]|nr:2-C-methyl-D-erythritol 2,4-cyclodiphosphate synthase [Clostridia bacterium]